ncbi:PIG-L family deacetylase [Candidatus Electrothrix sp.]|uniref:PIG-L family deacetylase n=1 Tax=Candidatus Electrothrix sp. TaxID=2170559 RepID=UPI00405665DA
MRYKHIYLSPHYDDAALSCGGSIHMQAKQQEPVAVITVFAGAPDLPNAALSKLAQAVHKYVTMVRYRGSYQ